MSGHCETTVHDKNIHSPKTITALTLNCGWILVRLQSFDSLSVLDSMNTDLNTILLERLVFLIWMVELVTKLQISTPDYILSRHRVLAFVYQGVHHLAVVSLFFGAIPRSDRVVIDRQLEQVSNTWRMGPFNGVLEPDLTSGVDGNVTGWNRVMW